MQQFVVFTATAFKTKTESMKQQSSEKFKILIPVDLSKESVDGLLTGISIARNADAEVVVFNVVREIEHMMGHYYEGFESFSNAFKIGQEKLDAQKERLKEDLQKVLKEKGKSDFPFRVELSNGYYRDALKAFLNENPMDLIVMGTNGRSTLVEFFKGSHAEKSVRISNVPVLAVQKTHKFGALKQVILGYEPRKFKEDIVKALKRTFELLGTQVHLVHVRQSEDDDATDAREQMQSFAEKYSFENCTFEVLEKGEVYRQLESYADQKGIKIISSISHGNNAFLKTLFGSKSGDIMRKTDKAVLVISE
jgi:nucleotide-binding universal stress UspA family protein